jgi:hypothetical protein
MKLANLWWAMAAASFCLAACSTSAAPTNAPTQVLIPAPPTLTPTSSIPTETPPPGLAPSDLIATPQVTAIAADLQPIIQQIVDDLASVLQIEVNEIQVVRIESVFWMTSQLGCDVDNADATERGAGYRVILAANSNFYEYHTDSGTRFLRCEEVNPTAAATMAVAVLLELDPVAAELAGLAQQRVAENLDLPIRRIRVVDIHAVRWTDSSLGCPQPDQVYTAIETDGYRIAVTAGEQMFIFHSDSDHLLVCDAADEQLPDD